MLPSSFYYAANNDKYKLTLKGNGELDIYCAAPYIWSSNTANSNAS